MTTPTKQSEIQRAWHLIDASETTLGRVSSKIAQLLMGKGKRYFVKNLDCGDYVVVTNSKLVKVTGKKELAKKYYNYSGYPGGLRVQTLQDLRKKKPEEIIIHAVKGMLPQNKLRDRMLTRLYIFADENHTYAERMKSADAKAMADK